MIDNMMIIILMINTTTPPCCYCILGTAEFNAFAQRHQPWLRMWVRQPRVFRRSAGEGIGTPHSAGKQVRADE
jgi:hypothetical protein